jgi:hypothetical protein
MNLSEDGDLHKEIQALAKAMHGALGQVPIGIGPKNNIDPKSVIDAVIANRSLIVNMSIDLSIRLTLLDLLIEKKLGIPSVENDDDIAVPFKEKLKELRQKYEEVKSKQESKVVKPRKNNRIIRPGDL